MLKERRRRAVSATASHGGGEEVDRDRYDDCYGCRGAQGGGYHRGARLDGRRVYSYECAQEYGCGKDGQTFHESAGAEPAGEIYRHAQAYHARGEHYFVEHVDVLIHIGPPFFSSVSLSPGGAAEARKARLHCRMRPQPAVARRFPPSRMDKKCGK